VQDADKDGITLDSVLEKSLEGYGEEAPVEAAPVVEDEPPAARDDGRDEQGRMPPQPRFLPWKGSRP
jgi:hypothetical protein